MKITKTQLKQIINEELRATLKEREQLQEGFLDNVLGFFGKMSVEDKAGVQAHRFYSF